MAVSSKGQKLCRRYEEEDEEEEEEGEEAEEEKAMWAYIVEWVCCSCA